jgi:hypothetical protein
MKRSKYFLTQDAKRKLTAKRDAFFRKIGGQGIALTYEDVRLSTGYSATLPDDVNLESKFSRNVGLKIPIVSAAMDTVTEAEMAIEIAKLGGLGVIHKNFDAQEQAYQVAKVKFHLNGFIEKPICFDENTPIGEILARKESAAGPLRVVRTFHPPSVAGAERQVLDEDVPEMEAAVPLGRERDHLEWLGRVRPFEEQELDARGMAAEYAEVDPAVSGGRAGGKA